MLDLAVFLGNPGGEYERNRHNAGRLLARKLPFYDDLVWKKKFKSFYASLERTVVSPSLSPAGTLPPLHLLMPETYMNLSGRAVRAAASFFKIPPRGIIAVHDELELPPGTVSLKYGGGLGGHNGLRSMKAELGTADFWRLRIGIGRPPGRLPGEGGPPGSGGDVAGWVLSDFSKTDALEGSLTAAAELLVRAFAEEPESLLPEWKKKTVIPTADRS
ncbi:MAG: aminoacyl-tRNA hydrolase [Treponema sp.]|jgi:PTH1 family peptidyl-tRNA hydrolase|nr:aminoacyl-tRNA hydrolase [Treponema sp.]